MFKELTVEGWGRVCRGAALVAKPERMRDIAVLFGNAKEKHICARGAGRSYGDCALNSGHVLAMTRELTRILAFNEHNGEIAVEPGVTFEQLLRIFLPRGWLVPVTPGTGFATIGGAVANDVHGKNHEHQGSFGQHITELDVMTPDGRLHTVGPDKNSEWFRATIGGLGLTGIVTRIAFRMMRIPGPCVLATEKKIANLESFFTAFEARRDSAFSVGWIDALARGRALGRGILETAEPMIGGNCASSRPGLNFAANFPNFALNGFSVAAFNAAYLHRVPRTGRTRPRHYADFLYPLDYIGNWNRIYGRRGFHQFQCVVPRNHALLAISLLLKEISDARAASFLAVLKRMGPGRAGLLSFPMEGYTLAVDFPNSTAIDALYARLVRIAQDYGGRIYLAKDALVSSDDFGAMYPELPQFRVIAAEMDPGGVMESDLARRLQIRACP